MKIKKFNFTYTLLFIIQLFLLFVCYLIYANKIVEPNNFAFFGLIALIFPVVFFMYLLIFGISLFYKKKRNVLLFLLSIPLFLTLTNWYKTPYKIPKKNGLKILSYNVQYTYGGIKDIEDYIDSTQAEIVFLQEIYKRHWRKEAFLPNNFNAVYDFVGISSKYPIVFEKAIPLGDHENAYACMADVKIKEDTIRLFNVYLESIYLSNVLEDIESTEDVEKSSNIVKEKLVNGYRKHQFQLEILEKYIQESPHPVIVAGDFNSVPNSYEYYKMTTVLKDAFSSKSKGLATTFHNYKYPLRIDYIYTDNHFDSNNYEVDRAFKKSDHFPVSVYLQKKSEEKKE